MGYTRTRDRGTERIADHLGVMEVVYVQNAENYVNYRARRAQIAAELPPGVCTDWDIKTRRVSLTGVGRHDECPVDNNINEYYLWHGTSPEGAQGTTDKEFDLGRVGTGKGTIFGAGLYLAESCLKADEYTKPDHRGWYPLLLSRVVLGNVNYCDAARPWEIKRQLENSCKRGRGHHSILGDREKVRNTFREFIVFDSHQVYPEYIVWYTRR